MDKKELRIFIAHAKGDSEASLFELREQITLALRKAFPSREAKVTLGRDDHAKNFQRAGSWDAWAREVATAVHPTTREPRYHGIVVPGVRSMEGNPFAAVGAATQGIVAHALGIGKPVLIYSNGSLTQARRVVKTRERDFKAGWTVS